MVIFHSYVSLPEGRYCNLKIGPKKACKGEYSTYCRLCECYTRTYHRAIGTEHDPYQGVLNKTRKPMSQVWNLCNFHLAWGYRSTHLERLRTCDVAPKLRGHVDLQPASILRPWSLKTVGFCWEHVVPDLWNIRAGWSMLFPSGSMVHAGAYDQKFGCLSESIHIGTVVNMTVDASLDEILLYRLNGANGAELILACVLLTLPFSFCLRLAVIFWWKHWATPHYFGENFCLIHMC